MISINISKACNNLQDDTIKKLQERISTSFLFKQSKRIDIDHKLKLNGILYTRRIKINKYLFDKRQHNNIIK